MGGEWIPVSERMPDDGLRVLTCSPNGNIRISQHTHKYMRTKSGWVTDSNYFISDRCRDGRIKAWMELPESYKEDV